MVDFECGRYDEAERRWQEARDLLEEIDPRQAAHALNNLEVLATMRGELDQAWTLYERVLQLVETETPSNQALKAYWNMGMVRADQGTLGRGPGAVRAQPGAVPDNPLGLRPAGPGAEPQRGFAWPG